MTQGKSIFFSNSRKDKSIEEFTILKPLKERPPATEEQRKESITLVNFRPSF